MYVKTWLNLKLVKKRQKKNPENNPYKKRVKYMAKVVEKCTSKDMRQKIINDKMYSSQLTISSRKINKVRIASKCKKKKLKHN